MPARVDIRERRQQVVDAAFRLIVKNGLEGLTIRKVALEAGLNVGSVRHFFDNREDLLTAAALKATTRMESRLKKYPVERLKTLRGDDAVSALQEILEQVLPVNEESREEAIIVIELIRASRTQPVFAECAAQMGSDLNDVIISALSCLAVPDPSIVARHISALIGGLTLDTITPHGSLTVPQLRATLRSALENILKMER
nr:TetR family transcriptional regulator C-terminal domain-containing protein [Corynebacterium uropygiale]